MRKPLIFLTACFLLLSSAFSPLLLPTVTAETTSGTTTLYFVDYDPLSFENTDDLGNTLLDTTKPTKTNDSIWPPPLLIKNTLIPRVNSEEWLSWFELWVMFKFMDVLPEDFEEFEDIPELQGLFDMYNPFKVRECYTYTGTEPGELNGKITFDIYLDSTSRILHQDTVVVSIGKSLLLSTKEIQNASATIKPTILPGRIKSYTLTIDLSSNPVEISPGETIVFSVEIKPSDRTIGNILERLSERGFEDKAKTITGRFAEFFLNRRNENLQDFGSTLKEFINMTEMFSEEGVNLSLSDVADLVNGMLGSSFIFGSNDHSSKVSMPLILPSVSQENTATYYLHQDMIMDTTMPSAEEPQTDNISVTPLLWYAPTMDRNKILTSAEATVYLDYRSLINLRKLTIQAALYDDEKEITTKTVVLNRTRLLDLIQKKQSVTTFTFTNVKYELWNGHQLGLGISLINESKLGLRKLNIVYDSVDSPSNIHVDFDETRNINMTWTASPADREIIPGGSVQYTLLLTSKYQDTITVDLDTENKRGDWEFTAQPETLTITPNASKTVIVTLESIDDSKDAYDDYSDLLINIVGKTGKVIKEASATVTQDAIVYDVDITVSNETELAVKKGHNLTMTFKIKNNNTAAYDDEDDYTILVTSENSWGLEYDTALEHVRTGKEKSLKVKLLVPENASPSSDSLTIKVTSDSDSSTSAIFNVTIQVNSDSIFEILYKFFESVADQLGLTETFGSDAPIILAALILIILFFFFVIIALLLTMKNVRLLCDQQIQEIPSGADAQFLVLIQNKTRKTRSYDIQAFTVPASSEWKIQTDTTQQIVGPRESKPVTVLVSSSSTVQPDDWIEVQVTVHEQGRRRLTRLQLMVNIVGGKLKLRMTRMFHWPREFTEGTRILTSFRIENDSPVSTRNVTAILSLNGEEKNRIGGLSIPGNGYAEVSIPWIAVKGKNQITVRLCEQ